VRGGGGGGHGLVHRDRCCEPPSKATIWWVVTGADAAAVDAAIGAWLAEQDTARQSGEPESATAGESDRASVLVAIAVDGKTVRGATDTQGNQVHLLAAATHENTLVVGQVEVGAKSNEIPLFAPLLDGLADAGVDLSQVVVTADALHTQRAHAEYLHERGAGFVFTVTHNQPRLFAALDALAWTQVPIAARDIDTGHGRITTRTIQVLPAPADLPFPHVNQVWLIERYTCDPAGNPLSAVAAGRDQPDHRPRRPHRGSRPGPKPLGYRVAALAARHRLPRGQLDRPHQIRTARNGSPAQSGHWSTPTDRPTRHHRSNPPRQPRHGPPLQDLQAHLMILKRPWIRAQVVEEPAQGRSGQGLGIVDLSFM
jgi:predicted transposase YbfD/YdcC